MLEISGYGRDEFTRDCLKGFDNGRDGRFIETVFNRLAEKKNVQFISDYKRPDNRIVTVDTRISVIDKNKGLAQSVVRDITHRKQTEGDLFSKKKQAGELKETNADVLLADRENDKKTMQDSILSNMKDMIFPYLEKLENSPLSELQKLYVRTIKNNICDITNPFINRLSSKFTPLTPMEIRVARLVKDGKTTKEIAELLSSTRGTIEFHRNNLRKKLGIRNSGTNLRAFLMSVK